MSLAAALLAAVAGACHATALWCLVRRRRADWAALFVLSGCAYLLIARTAL